jgi:hypothetical protein
MTDCKAGFAYECQTMAREVKKSFFGAFFGASWILKNQEVSVYAAFQQRLGFPSLRQKHSKERPSLTINP